MAITDNLLTKTHDPPGVSSQTTQATLRNPDRRRFRSNHTPHLRAGRHEITPCMPHTFPGAPRSLPLPRSELPRVQRQLQTADGE